MFWYLRIAVSALCLVVCLLLIALWVRSYRWTDVVSVGGLSTRFVYFCSQHGRLFLITGESQRHTDRSTWGIETHYTPGIVRAPKWGYEVLTAPARVSLKVPLWFPSVIFGSLVAFPWINWRFSLRTLLIAMTLVAVVLGMTVYWSR